MAKKLQEKMFRDMERIEIFKQAQSYAFDYAEMRLNAMFFQLMRRLVT